MVSFSKFSLSVSSAILLGAVSSLAAPWPTYSKHTTHRVREIAPGVKVTSFFPQSTYKVLKSNITADCVTEIRFGWLPKTFGEGIDLPQSKRSNPDSVEKSAIAFVKSQLGISDDEITPKSDFNGDTAKHAYLSQSINGVPVANAVANVAFNHANKVVAFGSNFVKPDSAPSSTPSITSADAIAKAESALSATYNDFPTSLEYFAKDDDTLILAHVVQVQNNEHWFEAFIDAHSGDLVSVHDFVAQASYKVIPLQQQSLLDGGFSTLADPQDTFSSPFGWHSDGTTSTTTTAGNNAIAFKSSQTATTSESSAGLNFIYTFNAAAAPATAPNVDVARVNAFYVVNSIHDITYRYGFTEAAFNFQNNNNGKGGKGNDRVTISVQDSSGVDNANFATPPDGQSGKMRMFIWDETTPDRDGAIENDIVSHENTHGLTNRMTGGGTARCLTTTEAGGMGEGWSDAFAEWTEHTSAAVPDFALGVYVTNDSAGIRSHPYSTSKTVNPLTYSNLRTLTEVHDIGEVWANMLHNVYAALVGAHGFSTVAKTDPTGTEGNVVFLHLFIDALALQPCNPTFLTARDAWIQADVNRFGGANKCILWTAFASRGLGVNAANHVDNGDVPAGC